MSYSVDVKLSVYDQKLSQSFFLPCHADSSRSQKTQVSYHLRNVYQELLGDSDGHSLEHCPAIFLHHAKLISVRSTVQIVVLKTPLRRSFSTISRCWRG